MNRERWQQVSRLYHEAGKYAPPERDAFLARACGADDSLRSEVMSLLRQQIAAGDEPALGVSRQTTDPDASLIGRRLGHFEICALLGVGGMGEVYRARDARLGRDVALKFLPGDVADDADRLARFEREAHVLAKLNHPNIAAIYGIEESDHLHALVLELVEGETLAQRVSSRGALPLDECLRIALQVAKALEAAHDKSIIHRDLKPANIKIAPDGTVKVLDFGIAKVMRHAPALGDLSRATTQAITAPTRMIVGTVPYMSPEQACGMDIDERADVWAFGCVLFEILTGRSAFARATRSATFSAILGGHVDWSCLPTGLPAALTSALHQCLECDTHRRLRYARDVRAELERIEASLEISRESQRHRPPPRRWWPRFKVTISIGVSVGVALLAVLLWPRTQITPQIATDRPKQESADPPRPELPQTTAPPIVVTDPIQPPSIGMEQQPRPTAATSPPSFLAPEEGGLRVLPNELAGDYQARVKSMRARYDAAIAQLAKSGANPKTIAALEGILRDTSPTYLDVAARLAEARKESLATAELHVRRARQLETLERFDDAIKELREAAVFDPSLKMEDEIKRIETSKIARGERACREARQQVNYRYADAVRNYRLAAQLLPRDHECYETAQKYAGSVLK